MESSDTTRLKIPGYRVLDVRGVGAMATVYHAVHESMGREVALKVLHDRVAEDADYRERFLRESRAAARLNHESVVRAYEAGESDGCYWLAMEYVQGEDLSERLDQEGSLSEEESIRIAIEVCRGLQVAADHGMVHRDVKPENILLGDDGQVKLADLGLAKMNEDGSGTVTAEGISVGTVAFFSPEQCRGRRDLDVRSDVFALGGTLYAMITGELPFGRGDNPPTTMKRILEDWPPELDDPTKFSPSVRQAVRVLMAKRRSDRPKDARAAASLLREALARLDESQVGELESMSDSTVDAREERGRLRHRRRRGALSKAVGGPFPAGVFLTGLVVVALGVAVAAKLRQPTAEPSVVAAATRGSPAPPVRVSPTRTVSSQPSPSPSLSLEAEVELGDASPALRYDWRSASQLKAWSVSGEGSEAAVEGGVLRFSGRGSLELDQSLPVPFELRCELTMPGSCALLLDAGGEGYRIQGGGLYGLHSSDLLAGEDLGQPEPQRWTLRLSDTEAQAWIDGAEQFRHPLQFGALEIRLAFVAARGAAIVFGPLEIRGAP